MVSNTKNNSRVVSQKNWIIISGIAFFISFAASILLILFAHKLSDYGITDKIYYLILIPLGFSSAAFLSGAMKSFASYKSDEKTFYGKLELGGPIVIFMLVVGGGFYIPKLTEDSSTFDLKVRIYSDDLETSRFDLGNMRLYLDDKTYLGNINEGEVVFSTIPNEFHNKNVRLELLLEGYQIVGEDKITISKDRRAIDLKVEKKSEFLTTEVRGNVFDESGYPVQDAVLNFGSGLATGNTNTIGDFVINVPSEPGTKLNLKILIQGKIHFSENVTLDANTPYSFKILSNQ